MRVETAVFLWFVVILLTIMGWRSSVHGELPEGMHLMTEVVKVDTVMMPCKTRATAILDSLWELDSINENKHHERR